MMLRWPINDKSALYRNERGVALLIVLLVTALLIALIFEFSYATRISLNSAVNFRNSQQAYFIARSGIYAFIRGGQKLREYFTQGKLHPLPIGDSIIEFIWWDESGKIKITNVKYDPTLSMAKGLFEDVKQIDTAVLNNLVGQFSDVSKLSLLSGLRPYMSSAEDFDKVKDSLTVNNVNPNLININAAPKDVLLGLGILSGDADRIVQDREAARYTEVSKVPGIGNLRIAGLDLSSYLTTTEGTIFKVNASATVGGYTKTVESVVDVSRPQNPVLYWRVF